MDNRNNAENKTKILVASYLSLPMLKQVHLFIKGDVLGVGFRAWTKIQSKLIKVTGWVRNEYNKPEIFGPCGGVEAVIQGNKEQVQRMVEVVKKGSPISRVDSVEILYEDPKQVFDSFEILKSRPHTIL